MSVHHKCRYIQGSVQASFTVMYNYMYFFYHLPLGYVNIAGKVHDLLVLLFNKHQGLATALRLGQTSKTT